MRFMNMRVIMIIRLMMRTTDIMNNKFTTTSMDTMITNTQNIRLTTQVTATEEAEELNIMVDQT